MAHSGNWATEYRPKTFAEVCGQEHAVSVLKNLAHADGIAARSIFLKGSWGSGKSTTSRLFGKALNCAEFKSKDDVCNSCDGCREAMSRTSQCYYEYDTSVAGNVETVRSLHESLQVATPYRRLVVFDEIHAASPGALAALLKMVEDGMPNTIFLFASTEDILPTLKSRSICLDISTIPYDKICERLRYVADREGLKATDDQLGLVAVKSCGHMRDALSTLQLFSMLGDRALDTSYSSFAGLIFALARKQDPEPYIASVLKYPVADIRQSVALFIRNAYSAKQGDMLYPVYSTGLCAKLFGYFYTPTAQQALRDEVGCEILLRNLILKFR